MDRPLVLGRFGVPGAGPELVPMSTEEHWDPLPGPCGRQRRTDTLRQERIKRLKRAIEQGQYQVPGMAVVSKWFPNAGVWNPGNRVFFP